MDTVPPIAISSVLREAAELKVEELDRAKAAFKCRYQFDIGSSTQPSTAKRVKTLTDDIKKFNPELGQDEDEDFVSRYIEQAQNDRSISESKLLRFEKQICSKISHYRNRLEVSSLHVELMKEAIDAGDSAVAVTDKLESTDLDDDFEVVENELDDVLEKFEKETFTSEDVDVEAIETYLFSLFEHADDKTGLEDIRNEMQEFSDEILADGMEVDQDFLMWCILDIIKGNNIGEDKKKSLEAYLQSPVALRELAATLSAKSIRHWAYKDAEKGLPVTARQDSEGQFRIAVEESIIDLLFLHAVGIGWAMKLRTSLMEFARTSQTFTVEGLTTAEKNKREFFLGRKPSNSAPIATACNVCHPYMPPAPMPPPQPFGMMPPPPPEIVVVGNTRKSKGKKKSHWLPISPPPSARRSLDKIRKDVYIKDFFMSRLPVQQGCTPKVMATEETQAKLIKTMAVEAKLREAFDDTMGNVDASSVHFESLASSLPHKTILTALKFLGVPETFLDFFERFLSAKLNIGPAVRGAPDRVLPRARGIPEGHALELFFTEAVMFFLEVAVHQKTGKYVYRINDRGYYVEPYELQNSCGTHVHQFAGVMGLDVTFDLEQDVGLVSITTTDLSIDVDKVVAYARRIKKQLSACTTIFEWVRIWNITAGTYAAHLFGPFAEVFSKSHLEAVKTAYITIFGIVLDGRDLTSYITDLLSIRLRLRNIEIPASFDALIYLPQAYGGLGVKNPFVTMALAKDLMADPSERVTNYLTSEESYYTTAASNYALLPASAYPAKLESIYANNESAIVASLGTATRDLSTFMSKEELFEHREKAAYPMLPFPPSPAIYVLTPLPDITALYDDLLREPVADMEYSDKIEDEVRRLSGKGDMTAWRHLSSEDKWVLQLYSDECFETYGGLEIWCSELVPGEVLKVVRGATWDEEDDGSSISSNYTEP
ncbi:hypothetical protein EK21DRAFT_105859 [Setomelanomma holmii]|uniref:Uncharacterized protein n=1 Tax=Setomelanomma holmii TaxID=210430 RepID=A0A9P4LU78_9PLEO|nr:hypothetical protein EK21DRAFT_105859 [Setomelanomma holmii]